MATWSENVEPVLALIEHITRYDGDLIDKLNHKYSTLTFIILSIISLACQYLNGSIKCWAPAQFPEPWFEYTNSICWISNTYFIPLKEYDILKFPRKEISYYQWVPLVLLLQAALCCVPCLNWYLLSRSSGTNINKMARFLRSPENANPAVRKEAIQFITKHLERMMQYTRDFRRDGCAQFKKSLADCGCFCGKRYGNFLMVSYAITKLLYIGNAFGQIYLIHKFLGTDYWLYGIEILRDLGFTGEYKESKHFPHVTLCDFTIRSVGKSQQHTVQCALPINIFNEKIFIFVWFWLAILVLVNALSLFYWIWIAFINNRRNYIKTYLRVSDNYNKETDNKKLTEFCQNYLRVDGYFVLRMISKNTNEIIVVEMIKRLWLGFLQKCKNDEDTPEHEADDPLCKSKPVNV